MILLNDYEISKWAFYQCKNESKNDTLQMRRLITNNEWVYCYCYYITDREEIWSKITESWWAYCYCKDVKDRPEVRRYIKDETNRWNKHK